jgi:hypothetical protein
MISALMPFLVKSPPTSATHNTPWLGETAENATLTLSAAPLGKLPPTAPPAAAAKLVRGSSKAENMMSATETQTREHTPNRNRIAFSFR